MALHRDIYWLGRQLAVTGFGLQAIDQRLKGAFDIEGANLAITARMPSRLRCRTGQFCSRQKERDCVLTHAMGFAK